MSNVLNLLKSVQNWKHNFWQNLKILRFDLNKKWPFLVHSLHQPILISIMCLKINLQHFCTHRGIHNLLFGHNFFFSKIQGKLLTKKSSTPGFNEHAAKNRQILWYGTLISFCFCLKYLIIFIKHSLFLFQSLKDIWPWHYWLHIYFYTSQHNHNK
jgi:hypothetical protein